MAERVPVPVGPDAPIMEVLATTRAMRRLKPDPVEPQLLDRLVEAATWAPSGGNAQAYGYVVVTDRGQMARLAEPWRAVANFYLDSIGAVGPEHMAPDRKGLVGGDVDRQELGHVNSRSRTSVAVIAVPSGQLLLRIRKM